MRRTWWFRPFATLLTLWLPLIVGEPSMLRPCPMHGAAVVAPAPSAHAGHEGHHAVVDHSAHGGAQIATHDSAPDHQHHNCSCIGCCATSPAVVPSFEAPIAVVVVATYPHASAPVAAVALPRPAPEYSRPYTTGPPRA